MAARLSVLSLNAVSKRILGPQRIQLGKQIIPSRSAVCTESGALLEKPEVTRFALTKVFAVVIPFLTFGGILSREFAALLEEHEIFAPDDDDDD